MCPTWRNHRALDAPSLTGILAAGCPVLLLTVGHSRPLCLPRQGDSVGLEEGG